MKLDFVNFVRQIYGDGFIPLHRPIFCGNEKNYLLDCIDSNFVSSAGKQVCDFERKVTSFTGAQHAIAVVNGTSALHVALILAGVTAGDEVITQALTFVATCNAISYVGAVPVFIDVDRDTLGMSPVSLRNFLEKNAIKKNGVVFNKSSGKIIKACLPMHTFGVPCRIQENLEICREWGIPLVEDAAESLGSFYDQKHTGTFGLLGTFSFNGNKIITTGGGGMIVTNDENLAHRAKHITTTAKVPHKFELNHDEVGYNFRLPSINAALGCAQMEKLRGMIEIKKKIADKYSLFFDEFGVQMIQPLANCISNHWLNGIVLKNNKEKNEFLQYTHKNDIMTRPIWKLMSDLTMYKHYQRDKLRNSRWLEKRVVNIPSSVDFLD